MTRLLKNLELPNMLIYLTLNSSIGCPSGEKGGRHASILCKVPGQKGNERPEGNNYEEWQTSDTGGQPLIYCIKQAIMCTLWTII